MSLAREQMRRRGARWTIVAATLCLLGGALSMQAVHTRRARMAATPRAVIYLIDTLRRDRLGTYGYARPTSPHIDALTRACTVFDRAYAPAPWTLPSVVSLLTSQDPLTHGLFTRGRHLDPGTASLAEILRRNGWATGAWVTNPFGGPASGLDRGYDRFRAVPPQTVRAAPVAKWLRTSGTRPAFAYVHTTEPHKPYQSPSPFLERFADVSPRRRAQLNRQANVLHTLTNWDFRRRQPVGTTRNDEQQGRLRRELADSRGELSDLYDAEVAWADDNVGRFVDALRAAGVWQSTLFILVSDHGEELFDHGDVSHGQSLYGELIRVPMIVCHPDGVGAGRRIDTTVSLLDVMPTVLAWAGVAVDGLAGRDLTPLLAGETMPDEPRVTSVRLNRHKYVPDGEAARGGANVAVADGRWRGIWNVERGTVELYDTDADPAERVDRAPADPARAAALERLAQQWAAGRWPNDLALAPSQVDAMDAKTIARLRALGYLP